MWDVTWEKKYYFVFCGIDTGHILYLNKLKVSNEIVDFNIIFS